MLCQNLPEAWHSWGCFCDAQGAAEAPQQPPPLRPGWMQQAATAHLQVHGCFQVGGKCDREGGVFQSVPQHSTGTRQLSTAATRPGRVAAGCHRSPAEGLH